MGLTANIYKPKYGDCSNGGMSSQMDDVIIINAEGPFHGDYTKCVKVVERKLLGMAAPYLTAYPITADGAPRTNAMAGGCFIHSSDSRFPSLYPIPLHDRFE